VLFLAAQIIFREPISSSGSPNHIPGAHIIFREPKSCFGSPNYIPGAQIIFWEPKVSTYSGNAAQPAPERFTCSVPRLWNSTNQSLPTQSFIKFSEKIGVVFNYGVLEVRHVLDSKPQDRNAGVRCLATPAKPRRQKTIHYSTLPQPLQYSANR
jgi:hypothetical protein